MKCTLTVVLVLLFSCVNSKVISVLKKFAKQTLSIHGFQIIVIADSIAHPETKEALRVLALKLSELEKIIQPKQLSFLKQVPIWIEWEHRKDGAMEYHRSKDWLVSHGYDPAKEKCIEINNVKNFLSWQKLNQPYMVLHEFAHAYHDRVLGATNKDVLAAYNLAVSVKKYQSVPYNLGGKKKAYALNDDYEYFAELTEAYLGKNDYFPFTKSELKDFDPGGFHLMQIAWGE